MKTPRPRIWLCHPMSSYGSDHEARCLVAFADLLPSMELIDPSGRYQTNAGWRRAWPRLLPTLSGLVVFGAEDQTIGVGCVTEVAEAILFGLPIAGFAPGRSPTLREVKALELLAPDERTARRVAWLRLGRPVDWRTSAELPVLEMETVS